MITNNDDDDDDDDDDGGGGNNNRDQFFSCLELPTDYHRAGLCVCVRACVIMNLRVGQLTYFAISTVSYEKYNPIFTC